MQETVSKFHFIPSYYLGQIHYVLGHPAIGLSVSSASPAWVQNRILFTKARNHFKENDGSLRKKKKIGVLTMTFKYGLGNNLFMQLFREGDHEWGT